MKTLLLCLSLLLLSYKSITQQLSIFGQYRANHSLINPASIGTQYWSQSVPYANEAGITARRQWTGFSDGPLTLVARYETIIPKFGTVLGLNLTSDKTGPTSQQGGQLRYAYMLMDNKNGTWLSAGISAGYYQWRYRADEAILRDAGDAVGLTSISSSFANVNTGVFYAALLGSDSKIFYCGLSVLQVASLRFSDDVIKQVPHFYGNVGLYLKNQTNDGDEYFIQPSAMISYVPNTPVLTDLTCRFYTPVKFWLGMGQSFSFSTARDGNSIKANNLLIETGFSTGDSWVGRDLNIGIGYHRSFTRFGPALGSSFELNISTFWK